MTWHDSYREIEQTERMLDLYHKEQRAVAAYHALLKTPELRKARARIRRVRKLMDALLSVYAKEHGLPDPWGPPPEPPP